MAERSHKKGRSRFIVGGLESSGEDSSVVTGSPSDFPVAALAAWNELPDEVKNDPYLSPFRRGYERHLSASPSLGSRNYKGAMTPTSSSEDVPDLEKRTQPQSLHSLNLMQAELNLQTDCEKSSSRRHSLAPPLSPIEEGFPAGDDCTDGASEQGKLRPWVRCIKIFCLFLLWLTFTVILMIKSEKVINWYQISVPENVTRMYWVLEHPVHNQVSFALQGAFLPPYYGNLSSKHMTVSLEVLEYRNFMQLVNNLSSFRNQHISMAKKIAASWVIPLVSNKDLIDFVPEITNKMTFSFGDLNLTSDQSLLRLQLKTNMDASFPVAISYDLTPINMDDGIVYAAVVLLGLYILIVFEIVHRTLAAMVASTMSVAILAALDERPTMSELISWIDVETLLLLFSMMMLVAVLAETGIFDYLAVFAYKITNGRVWPLVNTLCIFTALLSSFLDNVTTVLLMTPVTIRLCEVMELNPVPILMAMVIYSNIGGTLTPVGDPPNVIIASHPDVINGGIDFSTFTLHMGIGVVLAAALVYVQLRLTFRNINDLRFNEPQDVQELRHEIAIWQRAASSLSSYSKDEDIVRQTLLKRVRRLARDLKQKLSSGSVAIDTYKSTLEELQEKYPIRDRVLLIKSGIALLFVIVFFFLHSIPELKLSLGWTALLGAILLLLLADNEDVEGVLARVEWGTLLFFAALFVLMEALSRLGLIDWIGRQTEAVILSVNKDSRLMVAILLILWVSAIASSFVDNIPLTTMMVRIVTSLAVNEEIGLPLQPLVWALAFGACFGGNGTLIGSSANVVCAGVAEQHGYRFTFMQYFKIGFPVMLVSIFTASVYLLVCHVALMWH